MVKDFARESNLLDGIDSINADIVHTQALSKLLSNRCVNINILNEFAEKIDPQTSLREADEDLIIFGEKVPNEYKEVLKSIIYNTNTNSVHPIINYQSFIYYWPYYTSTTRIARALWLWQMIKFVKWNYKCSFLEKFHYQIIGLNIKARNGLCV